MIPPPELDALERLAEAATPGPWELSVSQEAIWQVNGRPHGTTTAERMLDAMRRNLIGRHIAFVGGNEMVDSVLTDPSIWRPEDEADTAESQKNAALIIAMRNHLLALITAARRAIELEASLKEIIGLIDDGYLIRDISKDHEPGYAMRQVEPIRKLCNAVRLTQGDPNA